MIRIGSEKELVDSFRTLDRDEVLLPPDLKFPFLVKDYLSWTEPSGHRVFLVFEQPGRREPMGIVFRRDQASGGRVASMCDWCHSIRTTGSISLLTATAAANRRVGVHLCRDLECKANILANPSADDMPFAPTPRERIQQLVRKMAEFAQQNLF